jgi:hypothetical protein
MNKPYQLLLALGIAAASLSSCSRANYVVNTTAPVSEPMQVAAPTSDAAASGTALVKVSASESALAEVAPSREATAVVAPRSAASHTVAAKIVKEAAQPVIAATPDVIAANVIPSPSAKPSLMQRLALKSVVKQINKVQQKQATARSEQTTASKKGRALLIALAGILLALIGLIIVGGSGLGGSGAGVAIGAILFYLGFIAFVVGVVIFVIHLVNGD